MSHVINDLLRQALQARKENRLKDAKTALDHAVQLCREDNACVELAAALTRLGQIERDLNSKNVALAHYKEAVGIYEPKAMRSGSPTRFDILAISIRR